MTRSEQRQEYEVLMGQGASFRSALAAFRKVGKVRQADESLGRISGTVGSGIWNMNPSDVTVSVEPVTAERTRIRFVAVAQEGLVFQDTANKAISRILDAPVMETGGEPGAPRDSLRPRCTPPERAVPAASVPEPQTPTAGAPAPTPIQGPASEVAPPAGPVAAAAVLTVKWLPEGSMRGLSGSPSALRGAGSLAYQGGEVSATGRTKTPTVGGSLFWTGLGGGILFGLVTRSLQVAVGFAVFGALGAILEAALRAVFLREKVVSGRVLDAVIDGRHRSVGVVISDVGGRPVQCCGRVDRPVEVVTAGWAEAVGQDHPGLPRQGTVTDGSGGCVHLLFIACVTLVVLIGGLALLINVLGSH